MFMKLLKQEWRSTKDVLGLLCGIILISGLTLGSGGFYLAWMDERWASGHDSILTIFVTLLLVAAMIVLAVCCAFGVFYFIWRFYQSHFTDQGYLTFTLPVSTHTHLLSSIVSIIRGSVIIALAGLAALAIAGGLLLTAFPGEIIWADVTYALRRYWPDIVQNFQENWRIILLVLSTGLVSILSEMMVILLSITVGAVLTQKHKLLAAAGVYFGIDLLLGFLSAFTVLTKVLSQTPYWFFSYSIGRGLCVMAVTYFLMHYLMDRKLNLN